MIFKNLTWKEITVGSVIFPPDGNIKLSQTIKVLDKYEWIDIVSSKFWEAILPDEVEWVWLIVSHIVCQKFPDRNDLFTVGWKIKNASGNIVAAQYLMINPYNSDK